MAFICDQCLGSESYVGILSSCLTWLVGLWVVV